MGQKKFPMTTNRLITIKLTNNNNKIESNAVFSKTFFLRKRAIIKIIRDPIVKINSAK